MKFIINCFILFICCITAISIEAQNKIKTEANSDIIEYTSKDGLPITNVSNILQTKDGYIWVSGIEGTFRFDGYEFYEVGKKQGVPQMQNIYYDSTKNVLYFASPKKFISFDGETFKVYGEKEGYKINGLSGQIISLFNADSKGRIWIGSLKEYVDDKYNGGLTMFDNGKFTVYDSTTFPLHNANGFVETPYGDLIFSSRGKNTQSGEEGYIALFKNNVFKKIGPAEGVYLQNPSFIPTIFTTSIDKDGNTWIAFSGINSSSGNTVFNNKNTAGVLMYDGNNFHQYPGLEGLNKSVNIPLLVYYSRNLDKLFLTTFSFDPMLFNSENKSILEFKNGRWVNSDFFNEVKFVTELNSNKIIYGYKYGAAFFAKANRFFPELLVLTSTSNSQMLSSKYFNQFYTYQNGNWEKYDSFNGVPVKGLDDGYILQTKKGFGIYYSNKSKMLTSQDGLLSLNAGIPIMIPDRNGIVWISYSYSELPAYANINDDGLNVWDGSNLHSFTVKDGLKSNTTFEVVHDSKYRIWIPTDRGITKAREIKNSDGNWIFKFENIPSDFKKHYNVTSVLETSVGKIYAWQNYIRPAYPGMTKSDFFMGKYDGERFVEIKSPFGKEHKKKKYQLVTLRENINGRVMIEGLFANNVKDLTSVHTQILILENNKWSKPPKSWNVPKEQLHYVGTLKNGMYYLTVGGFYNFNGKEFIDLSDSVDVNADFRILKEASVTGTFTNIQAGNRLYIRLRNKGLAIFDGKNLNFYTKKEGLPSADISNPQIDYNGNVIFGFPSGALIIKGEKFQTYYDDENIVTGGAYGAAMDINDNLLMLYRGMGLYVRHIENKSYPIKITSVSVDTTEYFFEYPKEFSYSDNSLVFKYAILNFRDPEQSKYEHYLEGYDKEWSRPNELAFAEYQNLPYGTYTFKVREVAHNSNNVIEASYAFIINPPMWKTWWAYLIYLFFVLGFLYTIREIELKRQGKNNAIKESKLRAEAAELQVKAAEAQAKLIHSDNERKTQELEEARKLQLSMLPKELPQLPNVDIAVYMQTATEVGGDYYDFHIHLDGTFTIVLGDATGHGMQAGMMVLIMKSLFMSDRSNKELLSFYNSTNSALKDMRLGRLMMALTSVQFHGNSIRYINAGMPPILMFKKRKNMVAELTVGNMPLGAMKAFPYSVEESQLESGDTLLLLSDGLPELTNDNNEMYGYEKVRNEFHSVGNKEPEEIVNYLKNTAAQWNKGKDPNDDVTFIAVKIK